MNTAYILLGSNEGDRQTHLLKAIEFIEKGAGSVVKQSEIYTTMAWGNLEQPDFLNQVLCVHTCFPPAQLLNSLLAIEEKLGRLRNGAKWMPRTIDTDILFYDELILHTADLVIPHPYIQDRKFVLIPLAEIAPQHLHPLLKKNMQSLVDQCTDLLEVKLFHAQTPIGIEVAMQQT